MKTWRAAILAVLVLAAGLVAGTAMAETHAGTGNAEVYVGWYWPDDDDPLSLDDFTYGVRLGATIRDRFGLSATVGRYEADDATSAVSVDVEQTLLDVSFEWLVTPDSRAVFVVYGGPGYAWADSDTVTVAGKTTIDDSFFTAHVGLGARISLGDRFYIRPDARVRWLDTTDEPIDWEATFALGWYIGAP